MQLFSEVCHGDCHSADAAEVEDPLCRVLPAVAEAVGGTVLQLLESRSKASSDERGCRRTDDSGGNRGRGTRNRCLLCSNQIHNEVYTLRIMLLVKINHLCYGSTPVPYDSKLERAYSLGMNTSDRL